MGGDDFIGRPLGGACVPTERLLSDLAGASEDTALPESIRKLAADLRASSAPPFEGLRAVYRSLEVAYGREKAPSLEQALRSDVRRRRREREGANDREAKEEATKRTTTTRTESKPKDPAVAARLQELKDAADQASYDAIVADVTAAERRAASRSGAGLSSSLASSASAAGLAMAASAGTGYAAGFAVAGKFWAGEDRESRAKRYVGGLVGLVAALAVEVGLVVIRALRAEREEERRLRPRSSSSSSSSSSLPLPRITRRLTDAELAAEAEVAAAVVAGAAAAARAGAAEKAAEAAAEAEKEAAAAEVEATTEEKKKK